MAVAVVAQKWWLWVCSGLIFCGVWPIHVLFHRRSYFVGLNPLKWKLRKAFPQVEQVVDASKEVNSDAAKGCAKDSVDE